MIEQEARTTCMTRAGAIISKGGDEGNVDGESLLAMIEGEVSKLVYGLHEA